MTNNITEDPTTDITLDVDTDCGLITSPVDHYFNAGSIADAVTESYNLGGFDFVCTQSTNPMTNDLVFGINGTIISSVLSYDSVENSITINSDPSKSYPRNQSLNLRWNATTQQYDNCGVLTVITDPADATVILTAAGYTQIDNTIMVKSGTSVSYTISKAGYVTKTGTIIVQENQTIQFKLLRNPSIYIPL